MSELFSTWEALANSDGVAGVSWAELQKRCWPGAGPGQAQGGWINDNTTIKNVLRQDWDAVKLLGATHLELVAHLDAVWRLGRPCDFENPKTEIEYDPRTLPHNSLKARGPVQLQLSCLRTRGIQEDLLDPSNWNKGWNTQWTVAGGDIKFQIGGENSSSGLLKYAKLFGFYEGGRSNEFRVDPTQLAKMLTSGDLDHALVLNS